MVGSLGANAAAAIGLVASSTWVLGSLSHGLCVGFNVQVAQAVGAGNSKLVKKLLIQALYSCFVFSIAIAVFSLLINQKLPLWLGGSSEIISDAAFYFLIFGVSTPFFITVYLTSGMLQCSGNMKFPAFMNGAMCILDIIFNFIFIVILKMGVKGAALGSGCAAFITAAIMLIHVLFYSEYLNLKGHKDFSIDYESIKKALKIGIPAGIESAAFSGALVVVSKIVAPLGSVALAANSFATTAEALCYMPGYGIQEAAVTLVGQSTGANRKDLVKSFSLMTILSGMLIMSFAGIIMFFLCPYIFQLLTSDAAVQQLSVKVLRIELFAEPMFAAAIVCGGCLRGKGDTLASSIICLFSLWVVRLGLSFWLVKPFGLTGIWIAMALELCFRGIIMLLRCFVFHKK